MRAMLGLAGILITLGIGFYLYRAQYPGSTDGADSPKQQIDVAGVRSDLLALAQGERLYLAGHGAYASLEQLQQEGAIQFSVSGRRGYNYTAELDGGRHFRITAAPADPAKAGWPVLSIDETMQISQK